MILPHHSTAMPEFNDIMAAGRAWICTTPTVCQTRKSFVIRTICFCHWPTMYRASSQMIGSRGSDCLLIVDGHTSRACPSALEIFRRFRVHVLTLPSHTSYICQFLDVGLASLLKRAIKSHLQRLGRRVGREGLSNDTVKVRWLLGNALTDAWYQVVTPNLCWTGP
jgi:hypothetical protein